MGELDGSKAHSGQSPHTSGARDVRDLGDIPDGAADFSLTGIVEAIDAIEATHHEYLRRELPRFSSSIAREALTHGDIHPELCELAVVFEEVRSSLEMHLWREEHLLFPMCRRLAGGRERKRFQCGTLNNPIHAMRSEHAAILAGLERMEVLTSGFSLPGGACNGYRSLMAGLAYFKAETTQHLKTESLDLYPRLAAL